MRHPHADMIIAKAENMDLVVFTKLSDKWITLCDWPTWDKDCEYFLSLPQHKEACLHWLNGGDVISANMDVRDGPINAYKGRWSAECYFMNKFHNLKIKPRKKKMWMGFNSTTNVTTSTLYNSLDAVKNATIRHKEWQFKEIEVEV